MDLNICLKNRSKFDIVLTFPFRCETEIDL